MVTVLVHKLLFRGNSTPMTTKSKLRNAKLVLEKMYGPLTFADRIASLEDWSRADMTKVLGVTKTHIAHMEAGKSISPKTAARYAQILGHSEASLIRLVLQDELRNAGITLSQSAQVG